MVSNAFVFFDIGDTLAKVRVSPAGNDIEEMKILPGVLPALEQLRLEKVRLGILSNRRNIEVEKVNKALESAGILLFFEPALIIYGPKDSTKIFDQAAAVVRNLSGEGESGNQILLFVGENADEREFARKAEFLTASHPQAALDALRQN